MAMHYLSCVVPYHCHIVSGASYELRYAGENMGKMVQCNVNESACLLRLEGDLVEWKKTAAANFAQDYNFGEAYTGKWLANC